MYHLPSVATLWAGLDFSEEFWFLKNTLVSNSLRLVIQYIQSLLQNYIFASLGNEF